MDPSLRYVHEEHKGEYGHIADFVIKYCQKQMKDYYKLQEVFIKAKPEDEDTECNIFMSKEFKEPNKEENSKKIAVVLIQGTGAVRAGIWARSVCINENIELGSMLPQLDWAINFNNYPVLVMNPNFKIPGLPDMGEHAKWVWKNYVEPAGFENILLIAHSAGGGCVSELMLDYPDHFFSTVKEIAYTDSFVI